MKKLTNKICLGTAQFGLDYGIANSRGKIPALEVKKILEYAWGRGIMFLDTAAAYGQSEDVLGQCLKNDLDEYKIITKAPDLMGGGSLGLNENLQASLKRLNRKSVYGYLFHQFENIKTDPSLLEQLRQLREGRLVEKIGYSLYQTEDLEYLIDNHLPFDIIQVPYSVFDQRFKILFTALKGRGVEIHCRSVFLQGLYFLSPEAVNSRFESAGEKIAELNRIAADTGILIQHLCLGFAILDPDIDKVVIGVDSFEQLVSNLDIEENIGQIKKVYHELEILRVDDPNVILPFLWNKKAQ